MDTTQELWQAASIRSTRIRGICRPGGEGGGEGAGTCAKGGGGGVICLYLGIPQAWPAGSNSRCLTPPTLDTWDVGQIAPQTGPNLRYRRIGAKSDVSNVRGKYDCMSNCIRISYNNYDIRSSREITITNFWQLSSSKLLSKLAHIWKRQPTSIYACMHSVYIL